MNKDNAHLYLPLVQALADGKTIQVLIGGEWKNNANPQFIYVPDNYRIKPLAFPPLPDGFTWHNPDGLTPEQVGEGWRLLTDVEICEDPPAYKACRCWLPSNDGSNDSPYYGNSSSCTYRVPISQPFPDGSFIQDGKLVKPEPPKPVPLEPIDWIKDGPWWVRTGENDMNPVMVIDVQSACIRFGQEGCYNVRDTMLLERTNDGITWTPCHKLP